jgi:hypothetical protein
VGATSTGLLRGKGGDTPPIVKISADAHDDVGSLRLKLTAHSGEAVALIVSEDCDNFDSPVAMHLLRRIAAGEAIRLAIVSERSSLRALAQSEGIRTFSSPSRVPNRIDRRVPPLFAAIFAQADQVVAHVGRSLSWLAAIAVVACLSLLALLLIPRAVVVVRPRVETLTSHQLLQASLNATEVDAAKGIVPARLIDLAVPADGQIAIDGKNRPLDGHAVGFETFENRTGSSITIPVGTIVNTYAHVAYATTAAATVEGRPGATAIVPIRALLPGPASNVRRGEILQIQGPLRWMMVAINEDQVAGGGNWSEHLVTTWDTQKLNDQLTAQAQQNARQQLASAVSTGEMAVAGSVTVTPIEQTFDRPIGSSADTLKLHEVFRATALIVDESRLRELGVLRWRPVPQAGYQLQTDSIAADPPRVVGATPTTTTFDVPVHATAFSDLNEARIASFVRLQPPDRAARNLARAIDLDAPPRVTITPNWLGRAYRVDVVLDTGQSAPRS